MQEKKEYAAVDLFKMFCAILVMLIHTKPFENVFWIDAGIGMITRFAVPFFFTVSGYFLFKRIKQQPEKKWMITNKYIFRLLRFYLIWFIVFRVTDIALGGEFLGFWYYIKQFFFTTDGSPLWFVSALLWAIIIVSLLNIWFGEKAVFAISIVFLLMGYSMSTLLSVTGDIGILITLKPITNFIGVQNGLFFAFPYVAMGALQSERNRETENKKDFFLILLFFITLGIESLIAVMKLSAPLTFLWISALPMTWFTVKLMLALEIESKPIYYTIRKISTVFYVLHVVVFKVLKRNIETFQTSDSMNLLLTVGTLIITAILAWLFVCASKKLTWLKYIM